MAKTEPFSMRMEPDLKRRLQKLADADKRNLTNYVEIQLERIADEGEQKQRRK
jgi:predicted transcriptional regulator